MTINESPYDSLIDHKTPVDYLEPEENENDYRECALKFTRLLSLAISYIVESSDPTVAGWGVAYSLGLPICEKSMREKGRQLNVSSGTISQHAKTFRRMAGLPPSMMQMDLETSDKYRQQINSKLV